MEDEDEDEDEEGREAAARLFLCQSLSLSFECEWRSAPRAAHKDPPLQKAPQPPFLEDFSISAAAPSSSALIGAN